MSQLPPRQALDVARSELEAAEQALASALSRITTAPRADKIAISAVLEQALDRLHIARTALQSLEVAVSALPVPTDRAR